MKTDFVPEFPYGLNQYDESQIKKIGLEIICDIPTSEIEYDNKALKDFFDAIEKSCKGSHVWALYGSNDKTNWIPFQVASRSSQNVISEIKSDFLCMIPYNKERDFRNWNSYFYQSVMEVRYGLDIKCQKYQKMKEMCKYLAITILEDESLLVEPKGIKISKYQKKECDIALMIKPLFWNPAGREFTYINQKHKEGLIK